MQLPLQLTTFRKNQVPWLAIVIPENNNSQADIDEKQLLIDLQNGDSVAFEQLYVAYSERLTAKLFRLFKSWEETEEALQQLFVKVWENRKKIDISQSFQAYLHTIASNIAIDYYRRISRDKALSDRLLRQINQLHYPETLSAQIMADAELMRTIERLPPQRKTVFRLCKLEGKTYAEVSRLLSISEATVGDHIAKAHKFIYKNYDKSIFLFCLVYVTKLLE